MQTVQHTRFNADKFVVRLPDGMRERIAGAARTRRRSMNSEIVSRLEQSIAAEENTIQNGVIIYLPDSISSEIEGQAKVNDRTVQGEVAYRLKRSTTVDQLNEEQTKMIGILLRRIDELESRVQPTEGMEC